MSSRRRNLKYNYLKTKIALSDTIQQLLDINRKRRYFKKDDERSDLLAEELKVLNATAEIQARALKTYKQHIDQSQERA